MGWRIVRIADAAHDRVVSDASWRCFVALPISADAGQRIHDGTAPLRRALHSDVRWVRPSGLHVTLVFLGDVGPAEVPAVVTALGKVRFSAFSLRCDGFGAFPSPLAPRVIWARLGGDLVALDNLAMAVRSALDRAGIAFDRRAMRAHLTIGRVRRGGRMPLPDNVGISEKLSPTTEFALFRSRLTPAGADYTVVARFGAKA